MSRKDSKQLPKGKRAISHGQIKNQSFVENCIFINSLVREGDYQSAFDIIDYMRKYSDKLQEEERGALKRKLFEILMDLHKETIINEFERYKRNNLMFTPSIEIKQSDYSGTVEEYCEAKAIDQLISQYRNYRYGGYMHVVIMDTIREYRNQEDPEQEKIDKKAKQKLMQNPFHTQTQQAKKDDLRHLLANIENR